MRTVSSIDEPAILSLLDQALDDIQGALLRDEVPDLSSQNMLQSIRERLSRNDENDQKSLIILQLALPDPEYFDPFK